jgi:hypothetical protein
MKDVAAPIYVDGRHWGNFRLAYKAAALEKAEKLLNRTIKSE